MIEKRFGGFGCSRWCSDRHLDGIGSFTHAESQKRAPLLLFGEQGANFIKRIAFISERQHKRLARSVAQRPPCSVAKFRRTIFEVACVERTSNRRVGFCR